jgi:hypothetical protein
MTKQEAKELSLEVWRYLDEHPDIAKKEGLPEKLYSKIKHLLGECPLCGLFILRIDICPDCPLVIDGCSCYNSKHPFQRWLKSKFELKRKEAAGETVRMLEAWEVKE